MANRKYTIESNVKTYTAKYYPLIDGRETEYVTTVEAKNKKSAESAIRRAFIEQLERMTQMVKMFNMTVVELNPADIQANIEYAKTSMRVEII